VDDSLLLVGGELLCHGFVVVVWCGVLVERRRRGVASIHCAFSITWARRIWRRGRERRMR
jgi:hypothetical protein